jgi:hypothetical protein
MIRSLIFGVLLLIFVGIALTGCATNMSEDDKFLWNGGTNAPASQR